MNENILPYMYLFGPALFNIIYVVIRIYNKKHKCAITVGDYGFSIIRNIRFFNDSMDRNNKKVLRIIIDVVLVFSILFPLFVFFINKVCD
jgi:hypothetical protein